jgi:hypothetical protein
MQRHKTYLLLSAIIIALTACTNKVPAASPTATESDCRRVYQQILNLVMKDQVDPEITLPYKEYLAAEWQLDQQYRTEGIRDRFFSVCEAHMTPRQVECALHAAHAQDINLCTKLLPSR